MGRDTRRTRLLLASLLVIALVLITVDVGAGKHGGGIRQVADNVPGRSSGWLPAAVRPIARVRLHRRCGQGTSRADALARKTLA